MRAFCLRENSFKIEEVDLKLIQNNEALVKIDFAALNRRDQWIREGKYPHIQFPAILGSDGCGTVVEIGDKGDSKWLNKKVIINPNINWGENNNVQSSSYEILGMPSYGTLSEFIVVNADRLFEKPEQLSDEQAAALPLAGLTAYNALFNKGKVEKGQNVLISGVGGGVAQFAFQFALAVGANVWVSSSKEEVLAKCMAMGASGRINYHRPEAYKTLKKESGGFDLIIDSACGASTNDRLMSLKPGGKYVFYGATTGIPENLNVRAMFWNHLSFMGSTMGSDQDFIKMVDFVKKYNVEPIIDGVYDLEEVEQAFNRMRDGFQFGKIVIKMP